MALAALPAYRRRAIELAYFGGLSHVQIARTLGVPCGPSAAAGARGQRDVARGPA